LDDCITGLIFKALQPAALEISMAAAEDQAAERQKQQNYWLQRLERTHIDSERAARQYNAVEPENRLVARTLERKWEEALAAEAQLKTQYEQFLLEQPALLTEAERLAIQNLAHDIPALWQADTTTAIDRQMIVRQLIERIVVTVVDSTETVQVEVHWQGGHITQTLVKRPVGRLEQMSDYQALMDRVKVLQSQGCSTPKMAEILNTEGWVPPKQRGTYNAPMVRSLLNRQGISLGTPKQQHIAGIAREADEWTVKELAQQLQMPEPTLYAWLKKGLIKARQVQANARSVWLVTANADQLEQLRQQRSTQRIWIQQPMDEIQ
jgi:DNA-binding MarR family transcriptional regulator